MSIELHDLQAEEAALAAAVTNPAACAYLVEHCREEDFGRSDSRSVLCAVAKLQAAGRPVDPVTVCTAVGSGAEPEDAERLGDYVAHLSESFVVAANVAEYVTSIVGHSAKRRAILAGGAIRDAAMSANGSVADLPGRLEVITAEAVQEMRGRCAASPAAGGAFIDWSTFWNRDDNQAEWVYPDVLARGRGHSLYASHKMGKSLLMLYIAAELATGSEPVVVVYLDYEMTEADIFDRLEDMGYGPGTDFSRLRYALLPALPPLDTATGAEALTGIVDGVQRAMPDHHVVVIIDTISRAVCGEENSADTFRDFYAHTGIQLKRRGMTWVRLDHGGKSPELGQRGSSGKGDDVDVVWKLTRTDNGVCLHRDLARMSWVLPNVTFGQYEDPLRYLRLTDDWPEGTGEVANILDRLNVPLDASTRAASAALKSIGEGRRRQAVVAAVRWRIQQSADGLLRPGTTPAAGSATEAPEQGLGTTDEQCSFKAGTDVRTTGNHESGQVWVSGGVTDKEPPVHSPHPADAFTAPEDSEIL